MNAETRKEAVNHPKHYGGADNTYEAIKVIEAWNLDFCLGNTIKYIARAGKKDRGKLLEDLEKAAWYLNRKIESVKTRKDTACQQHKALYCVIEKKSTVFDLSSFVDDLTQGKLPRMHVKPRLVKSEHFTDHCRTSALTVVLEVIPLYYSAGTDIFYLLLTEKEESKLAPVSLQRLHEYFENPELIKEMYEQ